MRFCDIATLCNYSSLQSPLKLFVIILHDNNIGNTIQCTSGGHFGPSSGGHYIRMETISDLGGVGGFMESAETLHQ